MWKYKYVSDWSKHWSRKVILTAPPPRYQLDMKQGIKYLTPDGTMVVTVGYMWDLFYRTKELGPDTVRKLLEVEFAKDKKEYKNLSQIDKELKITKFLAMTGWTKIAHDDLENMLATMPAKDGQQLVAEWQVLERVLAMEYFHDLERDVKLGRHETAQRHIEEFFNRDMESLLGDSQYGNQVFAFKLAYRKKQDQLELARRYLKDLPAIAPLQSRQFLQQAAADILQELNLDTLPRLETFLRVAHAYELARQRKRRPILDVKQTMAFALTGWTLGDAAAKENFSEAMQIWQARSFLLHYLRTENVVDRDNLRVRFKKDNKLGFDVLARIINRLPPPEPHKTIDSTVQQVQMKLPGRFNMGTYFVQLPPEYHHYRTYPVLIVLGNAGQSPRVMMQRWGKLASENGYILVAPEWTTMGQTMYQFSDREHLVVLNCIRDLRRHFAVDSDRVFLSGSQEGGMMAYDVGLSHPDQFAGVLPMAAWPEQNAWLYWSNAQYLPFYVVDGQRHGSSPERNEKMFKKWISWHYPVLYVEYIGRGREWFGGEMEQMFDWMNRKKRVFPLKQVGSGIGQQAENVFRTIRPGDNRFYWLSTVQIDRRYAQRPGVALNPNQLTATMWAKIHSQNEIYVYTRGLDQISIWIAPGLIDFSRKVKIRLNRANYKPIMLSPSMNVLLNDLYEHGDRQRVFVQKINLNIR